MATLTRKDILDCKRQIETCGLKPTKILMHPELWKSIVNFPLMRLYKMILEEGYRVTHQIEHEEGFEFWMCNGDSPDVVKMILRYADGPDN